MKTKTQRLCRLSGRPTSAARREILDLFVEGDYVGRVSYWITPIKADFGVGLKLEKFQAQGGEVYDVNLDGPRSSCECKGFMRWGHCKHLSACKALQKAGRL